MEDWSGTVYGPTTHGPVPRRKSSPRISPAKPETAAEPAPPRPRKRAATAKSADAPPAEPVPTGTGTASAPANRAPRKAAVPATAPAEAADDELLAHLDLVLADVAPAPAPAPSPAPWPTAPVPPIMPVPDRASLWSRLVAEPGLAPEHIVRETVQRIGSQAQEWVHHARARYPRAQPDALARLAVTEHVRAARHQALANTTALGSLAELGLLGRTQASLVLTIAAVYGSDPTADDRVQDLLELLPIPRRTQPSLAAAGNVGRLLGAVAVRRVSARLIPFGAAVAGAIHSGRTTQDVAVRSIDRFRPKPPSRDPRKGPL